MTFNEIIAATWRLYWSRLNDWIALAVPAYLVVFLFQWILTEAQSELPEPGDTEALLEVAPWIFSAFIGTLFADLFAELAIIAGATAVLRGGPLRAGTALQAAVGRYLVAVVATLLVVLLTLVLAVTLVLIPLAIYLYVRWYFIAPVVMIEGVGPLQALRWSAAIVRGNWWRTLGIGFAILLLALLPNFIFNLITGGAAETWVIAGGATVGGLLGAPFRSIANTIFYGDLRNRQGERPFPLPVGEKR